LYQGTTSVVPQTPHNQRWALAPAVCFLGDKRIMNAILGIDGGGTRTRASIVAGDRPLARAENGSIKRLRVGAEAAEANLRALLKEVYAQAGVTVVRAASVGVASASMPGTSEWITAVLHDFAVERSEVVGDEVIALDAAFRGGPGILQIAGTGTNTIGRAPDGSRESAGGWSSRLGDRGSGYWIGLHSVRRALNAYDREEPTQVLDRVGEIWGTPSLDDLVNLGDSTPGPDFAALAPAINELAESGDAVAREVLAEAATDLVNFVLLVRSKLRRKHAIEGEVPVAEIPVAWTGGVIEQMALVREAFFAGLKAAAPEMPVGHEPVVSLEGALWRAQCMAGDNS
jgi:N-acetylglucosamine kinase-like BadF-type ATPase